MHTTSEITRKRTIPAIAGAALAALVLAALVLVRLAGSGDVEQQASAEGSPAADQLEDRSPLLGEESTAVAEVSSPSDESRSLPPTSIVSTPHTVVDHPHLPPIGEDEPGRDPRNTPARWEVVVTPAHPVAGDEVTIEILWEDDEADTVVAQSWCHPGGGGGRHGLCADDFVSPPCDQPVDSGVEPRPGSGVLRFSFTAIDPGSYRWDHSAVIRSLPADLNEQCTTYDPWQDVVFASGTIDVAPAPHGDGADPPVWTEPVMQGDELAS